MGILEWSPGDTRSSLMLNPSLQPTRSPFVAPEAERGGSFWEAAQAAFVRENFILDHARINGHRAGSEHQLIRPGDGWNPYRVLGDLDDGTLQQLAPFIDRGLFNDARNEEELQALIGRYLEEQEMIEAVEGSFLGELAGSFATAIFDPTSYVPIIGATTRVGRFGRTALAATQTGAAIGAAEVSLHQTQQLRTLEESLMNVGVGSVLGGAFGALSRTLHPSHPMHPNNPVNPLRQENLSSQGVVARVVGAGDDSIGAARVDGTDIWTDPAPTKLQGDGLLSRATRPIRNVITGLTPVGRALRWRSDQARRVLTRVMDLGGVLTDTNRFGVRTAHSAEDLKNIYSSEMDMVELEFVGIQTRLNQDLAQAGVRKVDPVDIHETARRILKDTLGESHRSALSTRYGRQGAELVERAAQEHAGNVQRMNRVYADGLRGIGMIRDDARVGRLKSEIDRLRTERDAAKEAGQEVDDVTRQKIEDLRSELRAERAKPPDLGDDYGYAQIWDRDAVIQDREAFQGFLREVLVDEPAEEWLEEVRGMSLDDLRDLRDTDVSAYRSVLEEWSGDEWYHRISQLEAQVGVAERAASKAELDLNDALRNLGLLRRREGQVRLSEARKFRDKIAAELEAARQASAVRRADPNTPVRQMVREGRRLERLEARAERTRRLLDEAEARASDVKSARQAQSKVVSEARAARNIAAKDLRSVKRALLRQRKRTPMDEEIDRITSALISRNELPVSMIDRITPETGRMKGRRLLLNRDQTIEAEEAGWLRTDLPHILRASSEALSGHIAFREALEVGPGKRFSSWDAVVQSVRDDYQRLIDEAREGKPRTSLAAEMEDAIRDMNLVRDRLLGLADISGNPDSWLEWGSRKMRQTNFVRFGGGFLISSLTDTATVALRHRMSGLLKRQMRQAIRAMSNASPSELRAFVNATEIGMNGMSAARRAGTDDIVRFRGIGTPGTVKHRVTGLIDYGGEWLTDMVGQISLLPMWNRFWKITAGHMMSDKLGNFARRGWDKLGELDQIDLASLGIGERELSRIGRMVDEYGGTPDGIFDPGLERWHEAGQEGLDAIRDFKIAIVRDMNRAINTPGIGDTPRLMSNALGKWLLQFQTFAFTFVNRFMTPASQRAMLGDQHALEAFAVLMVAASTVVAAKDIQRGQNPMDRLDGDAWTNTLYDIVDRSGLMGWTSPYVDSAMKLAGLTGSTRYVRNNWLASMLGVNAALIRDVQSAGSAISDSFATGDVDNALRKLMVLAPLSSQLRLIYNNVFDRDGA